MRESRSIAFRECCTVHPSTVCMHACTRTHARTTVSICCGAEHFEAAKLHVVVVAGGAEEMKADVPAYDLAGRHRHDAHVSCALRVDAGLRARVGAAVERSA